MFTININSLSLRVQVLGHRVQLELETQSWELRLLQAFVMGVTVHNDTRGGLQVRHRTSSSRPSASLPMVLLWLCVAR
jgi:hypothetical protein